MAAIKVVLAYTAGKPEKTVNPDSLDQQELEQAHRGTQVVGEAIRSAQSIRPPVAAHLVRCHAALAQRLHAETLSRWIMQGFIDGDHGTPKAPEEGVPDSLSGLFPGGGAADPQSRKRAANKRT